ncbi:MAG TPA: mannitol-1-phosphate 5-dehydrogenase, partial [Alistipes obesi]|nr:mannitol-1-phosphate 5-dehydrogenase [Alistipes communis]
ADLVTTAVGLGVLPRVAPVIAAGLRARKAAGVAAPLNVVACENGVRATSRLKASVYEALDAPTAAWAERTVGFADCSVDR